MELETKRIEIAATEMKFSDDDVGVFSGLGAVFGNIDSFGDRIDRGAFKETLKEWDAKDKLPPMLLQHGGFFGPADDVLPIGQWTAMEENARGLKVEGKLFALGTERGQYLYEGMKAGELDGLSIGYLPVKFTMGTKPGQPRRTLQEIDLIEVSVVTDPANDKARVGGVKANDITTIREFETFLRDVGGYSRAAAKAIAEGGFKTTPDPRDEDGVAHFAERMQRLADSVTS